MLKKLINSARIDLEIIPIDPLLINSGHGTVGGPDMSFVRTGRFGEKDEPFIPGSSLKGMIRSYAEKICRSLRDKPVPVCLPYVEPGKEKNGESRQASCGLSFEKYKKVNKIDSISSSDIYGVSCPACRLFGSHCFSGRFATSDAYLTMKFKESGTYLLETRDGVAINRLTGGAATGAKYDMEVLTRGEFETTLEIRNFERWQLALTGLVLRDMEDGNVRLGFGKSRGLGRFRVKITNFILTCYNRQISHLSGIAKLCSEEERKSYRFFSETGDDSIFLPAPIINGLRYEYPITERWKDMLTPAVNDLVEYVKNVKWPQNLEDFLRRKF